MYIRTKDGRIIDTTKYSEHPASWSVQASDYALTIREAEKLEELCDLVRFKTKDSVIHYIDLHKNTIEDIVVHFGGENIIKDSFRYCIETDKGLIYVAKMNEKGELELI